MLPYDTLFVMEKKSEVTFLGQQENEKVLSIITPHPSVFTVGYIKLLGISIFFFIGFLFLQNISSAFAFVGLIFAIASFLVGSSLHRSMHQKRVVYITNRRIVRFEPSNAFVVNTRSLTWDNIIKVKTFSPSFLWRLKNIGTVIVHSKTTSTNATDNNQIFLNSDDIVLKDIHYFRDLGNYIDKVLYLYTHDQKELESIHPFVAKPKGQRY